MFAVIRTGGKQYKVQEGNRVKVEHLNNEEGSSVKIEEILVANDGDKVYVGSPKLDGGYVEAVIVKHFRSPKIIVFKKKRRKNYRRKNTHRQNLSLIEIKKIVIKGDK